MALSLAVTAPLLAPGYLLLRDAVSTPRSYLSDAALGLTDAAPRALPQDFAMALASHVVDGGVVVKGLLIVGLWLAGWGAARLAGQVLPEAGRPGQFVAATLAAWNPYVAERLLQGHWSLLLGYGALPWVAAAMLRLRTRTPPALIDAAWLMFFIALAGLTPTGLLLAALVAAACIAAPGGGCGRWLCAAVAAVAAAASALPWLLAPAVGGSMPSWSAAGVQEFAARAEPYLGTLGSLASLGGMWNGEAVPASRATVFAVVAALVLLAVVALGLPVAIRRPVAVPLLVLAAVAVVVPAVMATGPGLATLEAMIREFPGLAIARDAQKWVGAAMPGYALAGAAAVVTLRHRLPAVAAAALCCVALIATLPDLAWGVGGQLKSVHYPSAWRAVAAIVNADPKPVAVLPVDSMRRFPWAGEAPILDPLPRWVRADVLATGDLIIGGRTVAGEGRRVRAVQRLLQTGADRKALAAAGVGWVVVEAGGAGALPADLPVAYRDNELTVYRVGGDRPAAAGRAVMVAAHLVWLSLLLGALATATTTALRTRLARRRH